MYVYDLVLPCFVVVVIYYIDNSIRVTLWMIYNSREIHRTDIEPLSNIKTVQMKNADINLLKFVRTQQSALGST